MKALIVDDVEVNCRVMRGLLNRHGAECVIAQNGQKAVREFQKAWEAENPFNLMCLDIRMPGVDGIDVLNIIRQMEEKMHVTDQERCKIVIVTADADPRHEEAAEEMGADEYLVKPVDINQFHECLQALGLVQ